MADGPVVSLLPAATEIVCALGAADRLVAVSHECDHPEAIAGLPKLSRTRQSLEATGGVVHDRVRDLVGGWRCKRSVWSNASTSVSACCKPPRPLEAPARASVSLSGCRL